ncbi:unnamed protein product, partial [Ectocarpus sp. 8 AP-2014]
PDPRCGCAAGSGDNGGKRSPRSRLHENQSSGKTYPLNGDQRRLEVVGWALSPWSMLRPGRLKALLAAAVACYAVGVLLAGLHSWRAGRAKGAYSARASQDSLLAVVVPIYDGDEEP